MTTGYILDSDSASLLAHYPDKYPHLVERVRNTPQDRLWISSVVVEEALRGAFALINNPKNPANEILGCELLQQIMGAYSRFPILPYDEAARQIFKGMTAAEKRVGSNDCRIAAIAMSRNLVVVTRNVRDFGQIRGVTFEDWTLS